MGGFGFLDAEFGFYVAGVRITVWGVRVVLAA